MGEAPFPHCSLSLQTADKKARVDRGSNTGPLCPLTKEEGKKKRIDSGAVFVSPYLNVFTWKAGHEAPQEQER